MPIPVVLPSILLMPILVLFLPPSLSHTAVECPVVHTPCKQALLISLLTLICVSFPLGANKREIGEACAVYTQAHTHFSTPP